MRRLSSRLLPAVLALLYVLGPAIPVAAATPCAVPQKPVDEVVSALRLDAVPVDYVLVVDTSGSMQESGLYPKVTNALRTFVGAMKPTDHLSILTFDTAPTLRYSDSVGSDPSAALARLPATAEGQGTDIGAGIEAGLTELERPGAAAIGAVMLVTDGRIQADGSPYATASAPAWTALRERADRLAARHTIASYAYALTPATDAALLKNVFSHTVVIDLPPGQVENFLNRVPNENLRRKAAAVLQQDSKAGVEATWNVPLDPLALDGGSADIPLTLRSTFAHIPITVCGISAEVEGFDATVAELPGSLELAPGESVTVAARLSVDGLGGFGFGQTSETRTGTVTLALTVDSSWSEAMTRDLGVEFGPPRPVRSDPVRTVGTTGWSWPTLIMIALGVALLAGLAWLIRRLRMPRLTGSLELLDEGRPVTDFPLGGRVFALGKAPHTLPGTALTGTVRAVRRTNDYRANSERGVLVIAEADRTRGRSELFDGESMDIGSVTIIYTNTRK